MLKIILNIYHIHIQEKKHLTLIIDASKMKLLARDVGAAPTFSGLEPDAFADMLIPNNNLTK